MKWCVKPLGRTGSFVFQLFLYNSVSFWVFYRTNFPPAILQSLQQVTLKYHWYCKLIGQQQHHKEEEKLDEEEMEQLEEQISVGIFRLITSSVCISNWESQSSFMKLKLTIRHGGGKCTCNKTKSFESVPHCGVFQTC